MAGQSSNLKFPTGFEALFATVHSQLIRPADALVAEFHWYMVCEGWLCVGQGEALPASPTPPSRSELLPAGWNSNPLLYQLLYQQLSTSSSSSAADASATVRTLLLKVLLVDGDAQICISELAGDNSSVLVSENVQIRDFISDDTSSFLSTFTERSREQIRSTIRRNVSGPELQQPRPSPHDPYPDDHDPLRIGPPRRGPRAAPPVDPFGVGRQDLDPFARGGGGMYMDPRNFPGRVDPAAHLPPGAVPPGARFDPFGVPQPDDIPRPGRGGRGGRRGGDEFMPPGFDDMFM